MRFEGGGRRRPVHSLGMVHAIGSGIVICEIQRIPILHTEFSIGTGPTTRRVIRELHIDKALDVIDFEGGTQVKR